MGQRVSRTDFEVVYTDQPHTSRRKQMLEKYPQIRQLYGFDPNLKWIVTALVFVQFLVFFIIRDKYWLVVLLASYCFGGVIHHWIFSALHEITHNLAFGHSRPWSNKLFGIFANLPLGFPCFVSFRRYHMDHHKFLADPHSDPDIPTKLEIQLFCTTFGKFIWVLLLPLFYTLRPIVKIGKTPSLLEVFNFAVQIVFDVFVWYYFGVRTLFYSTFSSFCATSLHPVAGHLIAEHYMFKKGFETYSYYGILNKISFNLGYHNEHHDFPFIPGSSLPELKKIAPEFYNDLPSHSSWSKVVYDFIMDPTVGLNARIVRNTNEIDSKNKSL